MMDVKKIAEKWEIWNEEKAVRSEKKMKKLVPEWFYRYIKMFGKNRVRGC